MDGEAGSDAPVRAVLEVANGAAAGTRHEIVAEETIIGRSPNADVSVDDESVSREHAIVSFDPANGAFTIEDLQSTNGTKVNGKRQRSVELTDGDEITVGHTRLQFRINQ